MYGLHTDKTRKNKVKTATARSAKECAFLAVFVAVVIALQLALSAIPGVELVTVLFVTYAYVFGWKRGMAAATTFALLRQLLFGFFPTVLILYLIYYNFLTLLFGLLGKKIKFTYKFLPLLVVIACVCTLLFTVLDGVITPIWYGYTARATRAYFVAALPFTLPQVVCTAVSVATLFIPLYKVFVLAGKPILRKK